MYVVGVDFGTTNVRIASWDSSDPNSVPQPVEFDGATTMPAVIAFQRQRGGEVSTVVGTDADSMEDGDNTLVVRNIKRWAVSHDEYVKWNLESKKIRWETWWNPENRSVHVWGHEFPVKELIKRILAEACRQAGLDGRSFEWRAGCPVHASLDYRTELAQVMSELSGSEPKVGWVVEEPILFLVLALNLGTLNPGSYMVYDVGGGSFDCALAEVEAGGRMVVYAADGDPLLGGANIDDMLKERLKFEGRPSLLRLAKEQLTEAQPTVLVDADTNLSLADVEHVVAQSRFLDYTMLPMRLAYIASKMIWKTEGISPIATNVPSCRLMELPKALRADLDGIILFGGPVMSPVFSKWLMEKFGRNNVKLPGDLVQGQIRDPHLTALSAGACYVSTGNYNPLYTSRLPVKVALRNTRTGHSVEYIPYKHFAPRNINPVKPFISPCFAPQDGAEGSYQLTVDDVDGKNLIKKAVDINRVRRSATGKDSLRFMIDTLGRIWVGDEERMRMEIEEPPWQTGRQREVRRSIMEMQRQHEEREGGRVHRLVTENPYGWQSGHG